MRILLITLSLLIFLSPPSQAYDENGVYMIGGGVGGVSCSIFISQMADSHLNGGFDTVAGLDYVLPFVSYALGFQTGYNVAHPEIEDIFSATNDTTDTKKILYWVEYWCKSNPEGTFGIGLIDYASEQARILKK